jgi:hypothetical protein
VRRPRDNNVFLDLRNIVSLQPAGCLALVINQSKVLQSPTPERSHLVRNCHGFLAALVKNTLTFCD